MSAQAHGESPEAGFTLVEMLGALALFALLGSMLFGHLRTSVATWHLGSARAEQVDQVGGTHGLIRRLLADSYPLFVRSDPTRPRVDFDGGGEVLEFLAAAPAVLGAGGRYRYKFATEHRDGTTDLVMTAWPELGGKDDPASAKKSLLLTDIERAEFSYFEPPRDDRAGRWHSNWSGQIALPALVRLRVGFRANDSRRWPELVVAPRTAVDVTCSYDPLTRRCRGR